MTPGLLFQIGLALYILGFAIVAGRASLRSQRFLYRYHLTDAPPELSEEERDGRARRLSVTSMPRFNISCGSDEELHRLHQASDRAVRDFFLFLIGGGAVLIYLLIATSPRA